MGGFMASVKFIEHKGKRILHMDFAYSEMKEVMDAIDEAAALVEKEPPMSVLGLVDVSVSRFDKELTDKLKEFTAHNKPYMRMTAIVGIEKIKKVIYLAVMAFSGRKNLILKDTVEEAKDWLAAQ
jgi:hypothetical protein